MKSLAADTRPGSRQLALNMAMQVILHGQSLSRQLEQQLNHLPNNRDRAFTTELCYGICRYYFVLNQQLNTLLKKPFKPRDRDVQIILLLGLYQIRFMRVEDHAAVNESVKLLKHIKKAWAKGLVNAVLRAYLRQSAGTERSGNDLLSLSEHATAYPDWIRARIEKDWPVEADDALKAGNQRAPMVLRVNEQSISRQRYIERLEKESISARPHALVDGAVELDAPVEVDRLPGFDEALVSVQDSSAQLAAGLLDCEPGMRVLDACAAPGGKTLHIMQSTQNLEVTALDKDEQRLQRVSQNLHRAGLSARLIAADAGHPQSWFDGHLFHRILLDVPCSASGIIRRHPDIRLLRQAQDIPALVEVQRQLLDTVWSLLKPGGLLVYSTCSVFKSENEHQLEAFMASQTDCVERPINAVQWGMKRPVGRQILSGMNNMDGFYYACIEKIAS